MRLKDKVALITGSSRGIGRAIALEMASEGANIAVCYLSKRLEAKKVASEISKMGSKAAIFQINVVDRKSVKRAVADVAKEFGKIDILVNNAGINITNDFDKITDENWDKVVDVDLKGPFIVTQEVLKIMRKQKSGNIINLSSLSGEDGGPRTPSYSAAKAGILALTLNEAIFCAKYNIRVNAISPGVIASDLTEKTMHPDVKKKRLSQIILGRFGRVEEIGPAAVFLSSDDSSYITGEILHINGGAHLKL